MGIRWISGILMLLAAACPARADDSIPILSQSVPLNAGDLTQTRIGKLVYRGGVALRSPDKRFGGFSDFKVSFDGSRLLAISDEGFWLSATILYDSAGRIAGLTEAVIGELVGEDGRPLQGADSDAEGMAELPDGSLLVGFERNHRLLLYPPADPPFSKAPQRIPTPTGLDRAPGNGGAEALVHVGSNFVVAFSERLRAVGGASAGWVGQNGDWQPFAYLYGKGFQPAGAALMENGDILVLERKYTPGAGNAVRFIRIDRDAVGPDRLVAGRLIGSYGVPLTIDNFEGVAVRTGENGETLIFVLSDDNFNPLQRTLLMMFALVE